MKNKKRINQEEIDAVKHFVELVAGSEELAKDVAGEDYTKKIKKNFIYANRRIASQEKKPRGI